LLSYVAEQHSSLENNNRYYIDLFPFVLTKTNKQKQQ
jgi:hypothetical protein